MPTSASKTFKKNERLKSRTDILKLMSRGTRCTHHPIAAKYVAPAERNSSENNIPLNRIMVSVPKKLFKRAVDRNLLKRRIREAYRLNKNILEPSSANINFTYIATEILPYSIIEDAVKDILKTIGSKTLSTESGRDKEKEDGKSRETEDRRNKETEGSKCKGTDDRRNKETEGSRSKETDDRRNKETEGSKCKEADDRRNKEEAASIDKCTVNQPETNACTEHKKEMSGWGKIKYALKQVLIFPFVILIKFYQICISPLKPPTCRFTPTCSQYAADAFRKYGPFKGLYLAVKRILRCHPWGGHGYDPVP